MTKRTLSPAQQSVRFLFFLEGMLTQLAHLQEEVPQRARQAINDARGELETARDLIKDKR